LSVQVELNSANEIGILARSFNRMVEQLREYFTALEATNADLEVRVAERTAALASANRALQRLAHIDGLTEIANRRRFDQFLAEAWQPEQPLSLILCDVDFFKRYNDLYGHQQGDDCLRRIAQSLLQVVQCPTDLVARYGGEEFAVVLSNTPMDRAVTVAEQLRCAVHSLHLPHQGSGVGEYVTLSVGVACVIPHASRTVEALIAAADAALYEAKQRGRNRAIAYAA
jgi:diguanylate cyclase (GGDEF)-like protein